MTVGERNVARLAEDAQDRLGDHESLEFEGRRFHSAELFARACRAAAGLVDLGVAPGDRVAVVMANCPELGLTYSAIWRAGGIAVPVIFLLPPDELRHVLADSGASVVVTTAEFLGNVRAATESLEAVRHIVCVDTPDEGAVDYGALESADAGPIVPRGDDDPAAILYTGGTTGRAKGVTLTHANLYECARSSHEASYIEGVTRTIVPLPLSHAFGLMVTVTGMHAVEPGFAVLMRWFDPAGFVDLVAEHRIQRGTVVPAMLNLLLAQPLEERDLSTLRYLICGAAPLSVDLAREVERRVPGVEVLEGYGCTESGGVMAVNPPGARRLGTVGKPLPRYEVRITDDDGNEVPTGEIGEVCCRSAGVMAGYWNDPEATAATLVDGWLHTGDLGYLDDDGYLTIADRKKDLIIRGGFNVFPSDVEDALAEHPAVAMAGVVGRPDDAHGEEVVAFVSLHPGAEATPDELVAFGKERLGGYKYPREVHIVGQVPLTPVLKIDRKALRAFL